MQKQMKSLFTTMLAIGLFCQSQAADLFTPVQKTELRAPSVPLITSDPYLSIWSPYDKLNEGSTEHWTGTEHPLIGAVRVDNAKLTGTSRTYSPKFGFIDNTADVEYFTIDESGAYAPAQPEITINIED